MAWYDEACFYHIYPLGLCDAPKENKYEAPVHRLRTVFPWIEHIKELGCNAIYIGPLFESVGHGYETTDYKKLDSRLGDHDDLKEFVKKCHEKGIHVILDGVFNHVGRDFFAFKDLQQNRENSGYKDWFCNVNFWNNNEYNDGFSYDNWGGYNLLVKLNQRNPAVRDYIADVIRFWVKEFDIDGIRLDAADVLDFDFMKMLRYIAGEVKPDFWLMGEVIHGEYSRWVNEGTLHSVTNYQLHKALYSGHNDHNYFEIAHTVKRLYDMGGQRADGLRLYNFVDNHDVERIHTKLNNKAHFAPVHILLYTLPGIPSIYYGSEFGIDGKKEQGSDASLRPALHLEDFKDAVCHNECTRLIAKLGRIHSLVKALSYGDYNQQMLTNRQYAFTRGLDGNNVIITVNNDDSDFVMTVNGATDNSYIGLLSGQKVDTVNGSICVNVKKCSGDIWVPACLGISSNSMNSADSKVSSNPQNTIDSSVFTEAVDSSASALSSEMRKDQSADSPKTTLADCLKEIPAKMNTTASKEVITQSLEDTSDNKSTDSCIESHTQSDPIAKAYQEGFEKGVTEGLQQAILAIMEKNGYVSDQMRNDVKNNIWHDSLINWIKSFR